MDSNKQLELYQQIMSKLPERNPNPMVRLGKTEGEKCKDCKFLLRKHYSKIYYKCEFRGNTNGPGTDHRVNWDACIKFEVDTSDESMMKRRKNQKKPPFNV